MKKLILSVLFLIFHFQAEAQWNCSDSIVNNKPSNIIGFVPSKHKVINGWAISYIQGLSYCSYMDSVQINGIYTNISPIDALASSMNIMMMPGLFLTKETYQPINSESSFYDSLQVKHKLNGISISLVEDGYNFCMQGLQFSGVCHSMEKLNGISISLIASSYNQFNGLMASGVYNQAYKGKGVQIGLINRIAKFKGVQIGLWNSNEKRSLPFINWNFKKS